MTRPRATLLFACLLASFPLLTHAQSDQIGISIESLRPEDPVHFHRSADKESDIVDATNGVIVTFEDSVLTAERVELNTKTFDAEAAGQVRIQQGDQVFASDHVFYNLKTRQMSSEKFRTGKPPVFAEGRGLHGDLTNNVYNATNAFLTSDDISEPDFKIRARRIRIVPEVRIQAWDAVLYLGEVPVFYFPYYSRNLGQRANNFSFVPGYRSSFGPFILGSYTWFLNDQLDGTLHLDYRQRRGFGGGPDVNFHLGRWGEGTLRYYYTHDDDPRTNAIAPVVREDRQRVYFSYQANPFTNFNFKSLVRYQNDAGFIHDFFPGEYRRDPQPDTFVEANKFWNNFSLDLLTRPRLNPFYETVERLPDVRLSGFRQQLGELPFYYESESSAGWYRRLFAETNGPTPPHFEAARADTYHQITLPETLFGWLNITPRVGGRFTYYSDDEGPGGSNDEAKRVVFNTGAEVSFKASRLWPAAHSSFLDLDGVRHIVEPSVNYVYVPRPNDRPNELPQFDYELPSLRMLPIEFPEYNAIDSIDSQNVLRLGLRNRLQTKRAGRVEDWLDWEVFADWRLRPRS